MWNNFEQSPLEDETISNAFSSRGIFRITSDEEVAFLCKRIQKSFVYYFQLFISPGASLGYSISTGQGIGTKQQNGYSH